MQHVENEDLANIKAWLLKHGHSITRTLLYKKHAFPPVDSFDWLIIMGGPMNVDELRKYSWLKKEKTFIKNSMRAGRIVLGVCLGAQLIARVLGAKVKKSRYKEIGWHKVRLTSAGKASVLFRDFPSSFAPIHWHGDTFILPKGTKILASSKACKNQAFEYNGRVFAVQFHVEYAPVHVLDFFKAEGKPDIKGKFEQGAKEILGRPGLFSELKALTEKLLKNIEKTF
jgi:GMP synthase-like glutamine amidotransferase